MNKIRDFRNFEFWENKKKLKRIVLVLSLSVVMILSGIGILTTYLLNQIPDREFPQQITASFSYWDVIDPYATVTTEGLEVALYLNGVFVEFLYCNALSEIIFDIAIYTNIIDGATIPNYELRVTQGITTEIFSVDIEGVNTFEISGVEMDMYVWEGGVPVSSYQILKWNVITSEWQIWSNVPCDAEGHAITDYSLSPGLYAIYDDVLLEHLTFEVLQTTIEPFTILVGVVEKTSKLKRISQNSKI